MTLSLLFARVYLANILLSRVDLGSEVEQETFLMMSVFRVHFKCYFRLLMIISNIFVYDYFSIFPLHLVLFCIEQIFV